MVDDLNSLGKFYDKIKNSVTLKLLVIGIIVLVLQIPTYMIEGLNKRREKTGKEAQQEIFSQWSRKQVVGGPVLCLQGAKPETVLPDKLQITGKIEPELRYRGIFQAAVYTVELHISGSFDLKRDLGGIPPNDSSLLFFQVSDIKGLVESRITVNGAERSAEPLAVHNLPSGTGFIVPLRDLPGESPDTLAFECKLTLNGSEELKFLPLGRETRVELASGWAAPGFIGDFLPQSREITDKGFTAEYRINELNRAIPQKWSGTEHSIGKNSFGVNFYIPGNIYLQTMRAIRYSALVIVFTLLTFFFTERLTRCRMHPLQYFMAGLAVVFFYVILLSLGEHLPFAQAYLAGALAVSLALGYYARLIFRKNLPALVEALLMLAAYGAVYVMLRMEDFALLTGTIILFVLLIVLMTLTGNLNRRKENES